MSTGLKVRTIVAQVEGTPLPPDPPPFQQGGQQSGGAGQRNIPRGHEFDARTLKPLSRALFSASVSLGHAVTAYKEFARVKSSSVSPDGMLGGRGYVMNVKDLRAHLQQACELLSGITDTLYDELNAPHWKPKMADLSENEAEDINELMDEAGQVIADPEGFGEAEIEEVESRNDGGEKGPSSKVPDTGGPETTPAAPFGAGGDAVKTASAVDMDLEWKAPKANSSVPVTTLPGPRVDHLDRADQQTGPGGSYNKDEEPVGGIPDGWQTGLREENYTSVFAGDPRSGVPDSNTEPTETSANDFGLGYGAKGQGSEGYGTKSPDGRGVEGPASDLPSDPGAKKKDDEEGANPYLDGIDRNMFGTSEMPDPGPPARSDYFDGDKGNQFNVSVRGEAELPGESSVYNYDRDTPNTGDSFERQDVPYVKYDHNVHDYRSDPQDLYQYDEKVKTNG